jgi:hypothetical protein
MLSKTERIVIAILVVIAGAGFFWFMMHSAMEKVAEKERQKKRTEADFVDREYVLHEIWVREITHQPGGLKQAYLFLKPEGEEFNLTFGAEATDYQKSTEIQDRLAGLLHPGDRITVSMDKVKLAEVRDNGFSARIFRFLSDSNREVEMYRLDVDGEAVYRQPIDSSSSEDRGFSMRNVLIAAFVVAMGYMLVRNLAVFFLKKRRSAGNAVGCE